MKYSSLKKGMMYRLLAEALTDKSEKKHSNIFYIFYFLLIIAAVQSPSHRAARRGCCM